MIEIYGDLLFLENLLMNYMVLMLTAKVCSIDKKNKRIILGAMVGAFYSFVFLMPSMDFLGSTVMKLVMSFFIIFIVYSPVKKKTFIKLIISFYIINFAFGGLIVGTIYFTQFSGLVKNNIVYIDNISYLEVILIGLGGYIFINYVADIFKSKIIKRDLEMKVSIEIEKTSILLCIKWIGLYSTEKVIPIDEIDNFEMLYDTSKDDNRCYMLPYSVTINCNIKKIELPVYLSEMETKWLYNKLMELL